MASGGWASPARSLLAVALSCALLVPAQGSYRFGTLNWKAVKDPAVPPNTVDFELVTAWRRDFNWVYVAQHPAPQGAQPRTLEDRPIVGDKLRVTGLSFADDTGMQSVEAGTSEILFHTGDGKTYFVDVDVTAFSESENWVMGVTKIRHTYARPYYSKDKNVYPLGYSYEASSGAMLDANQPFSHAPWTAHFEGCCRWGSSLDANKNMPYKVVTHIDMTDRDNSPAARTMPIITVTQAASTDMNAQPRFFVMAKDQYVPGSQAPVGVSGGTSNFPNDNSKDAPLTYKIAQATDLNLPASKYTPYASITLVNSNTGEMMMVTNRTSGPLATGYYQAALRVDSCSSRPDYATLGVICRGGTIIDFMVRVVANGANNDGKMPVPVNSVGQQYMGEHRVRETKFGWVGYKMEAHVRINNPRGNKVVLNYVFAGLTVEGSSAESGAVQYSASELSHQGLPAGAKLYSTAEGAVVEVAITFDNPFAAHRPGHDAAMNKDKLDYASAPGAKDLWDKGFRPVLKPRHQLSAINPVAIDSTISFAAFDMNTGTGGAAVYLWLRRSNTEAAITELAISHCEDEEHALTGKGFVMLPQNVNEQSKSNSVVKVWYKKGTSAAITDVMLVDQAVDTQWCNSSLTTVDICGGGNAGMQAHPFAKCGGMKLVPGNLNFGAGQPLLNGRGVFMYVHNAPDSHLRRVLQWTPQVAGHYILCYAGAEPAHAAMASTQRCIDLDVKVDPAPKFEALPDLSTIMGKILTFTISYVDINHEDERVSIKSEASGLQLAGAKFVGPPTMTVVDERRVRTSQVVEWFPDATYGGFKGDICYTGTDEGGNAFRHVQVATGCVNIFVERCQWYVQTEDTLIQVAARFATNWLQIWHFNPTIMHPDSALPPKSVINIGHLYEVEPNDAMAVLAERFGTSIKHIRMNNWDLAQMSDAMLPLGKSICVIPNSCVTAAHVQRDVAA